jgi:hypothetical protein
MDKKEYDFTPLAEFMDREAGPEELAGFLDTVEEKLVSYLLNDPHAGIPVGTENEWYHLRQLRKIMEQMAFNERATARHLEKTGQAVNPSCEKLSTQAKDRF